MADPNPWVYIGIFVVAIAGGAVLISFFYSLIVAAAAARFSDKTLGNFNKEATELMPCTDCGRCKQKTCAAFAEAYLREEVEWNKCPYLDEETGDLLLECREKLMQIMEDPTPPENRKDSYWDKKF